MIEILTRPQVVLIASASLQVCWLMAIWWTGATVNVEKLLVLIACSLGVVFFIYRAPTAVLYRIRQYGLAILPRSGIRDVLALSVVVIVVGTIYSIYQGFETLVAEGGVYNASLLVAREGLASLFAQYGQLHWLGIQHPPFVPILNGFALWLFVEDLLVVRLLSLVFGLGTVLALYGLGRELYDREVGLVASLAFLCFPYFFRLSAAASNDIQVTFFFVLTLLIAFRLRRRPSMSLAIMGGVVLGMGILSKYPMLLIYPVLAHVLWIIRRQRVARRCLMLLLLVSLAITFLWIVCVYRLGIFDLQARTLVGFSKSATSMVWGKWMFLEFVSTRLPSALGVYSLPVLAVGGMFMTTRSENPVDRIIVVWVVIVFGAFSVTLPDARYCMPAFPALALIMARGLARMDQIKEKMLWLLIIECAIALYLFVDWQRSSHLFMNEFPVTTG